MEEGGEEGGGRPLALQALVPGLRTVGCFGVRQRAGPELVAVADTAGGPGRGASVDVSTCKGPRARRAESPTRRTPASGPIAHRYRSAAERCSNHPERHRDPAARHQATTRITGTGHRLERLAQHALRLRLRLHLHLHLHLHHLGTARTT